MALLKSSPATILRATSMPFYPVDKGVAPSGECRPSNETIESRVGAGSERSEVYNKAIKYTNYEA